MLVSINEVTPQRARLVLGWVTVFCKQSTWVGLGYLSSHPGPLSLLVQWDGKWLLWIFHPVTVNFIIMPFTFELDLSFTHTRCVVLRGTMSSVNVTLDIVKNNHGVKYIGQRSSSPKASFSQTYRLHSRPQSIYRPTYSVSQKGPLLALV